MAKYIILSLVCLFLSYNARVESQETTEAHASCTLVNLVINNANITDELVIDSITLPLIFGSLFDVTFKATNIKISGFNELRFERCDLTPPYLMDVIPMLNIDFENYDMSGTLDGHIDLHGNGHGSVLIEDFSVAAFGNFTHDGPPPAFEYLQIDLEMFQWTVNLENLQPGTDLGLLFNEFFSELGPEMLDTIEKVLNTDENEPMLRVVNELLAALYDKISPSLPTSTTEGGEINFDLDYEN